MSDSPRLGPVAAVDLDGVGARAALVEVGIVAGVPDHAVVAGLAEGLVVGVAAGEGVVLGAAEEEVRAALAEEDVVAGLAEELVRAGAAGEDVVAATAEQVGAGKRAVGLVEGDDVVAALAENLDEGGVGHGGGAALDGDRAAVDEQAACGVSGHADDVGEVVAEDAQDAGGGAEGCDDGGDRAVLEALKEEAAAEADIVYVHGNRLSNRGRVGGAAGAEYTGFGSPRGRPLSCRSGRPAESGQTFSG